MQPVNSGTAYILWCLCLFGICGAQRFYAGNTGMGVLYLLTFGLCGIGQLLDLVLIPNMIETRNVFLRGAMGSQSVNQSVTVNLGDIPQLQNLQAPAPVASAMTPMQRLLKAAKDQGGQLSPAQAAMYTELEPEHVKNLLQEATTSGYAEVINDPKTGAIRYHFDV